jgi:hypothetical protein
MLGFPTVGDFDFLVGSWNVVSRRRASRLAGCDDWEEAPASSTCWRAFDGMANIDEFVFSGGKRGLTLRLFDRATAEWSIYWAVNGRSTLDPPVVGRFTDGRGLFYGDDTHEGTPVRVRFIWSEITANSARWEQAFSADGETTWEVNWIMEFTRA